jgi:hypothetical protein
MRGKHLFSNENPNNYPASALNADDMDINAGRLNTPTASLLQKTIIGYLPAIRN